MEFVAASLTSELAFLIIVIAVIGAFGWAIYFSSEKQDKSGKLAALKFIAGCIFLIGLVAFVTTQGILAAAMMPRLPIFVAVSIVISIGFGLSPISESLAQTTPLALLVLFQGFRLPLELILHSWVNQGTIPETMTWTGSNIDIITGIVACSLAPLARTQRWAAWVANVVGIVLLLNVMRVALMSAPLPFGWDIQPKLLVALYMPYALIVPFCVGGALAGHIILTRALISRIPRSSGMGMQQ
jgi:hypothetical protein